MNKDTELFKASFYADLPVIKRLVKTESDLQIKIPIKEGDYALYWNGNFVLISILEVLNWSAFGFYEYIEENILCHRMFDTNNVQILNDCINPSEYYKNILNCIEWICNKFSIHNYHLKDYSYYSPLSRFLFDDEEYLIDDEIVEALKDGFCQIDLDLINVAAKGNGIASYELIKKGANYNIDPLDYTNESLIINILESNNSFHMLRTISYLSHKESFRIHEPYEVLSSLYQVGVGNYILDIITTKI
ncbi:MAG: hypothetical protein GX879_08885 [Bacteroidales bacterium]|nr:hypothetical protein [Bacteroidales bacterium]